MPLQLDALAGIMAAMANAGLESSSLFCLTDDTREMVDEVSERGSRAQGTRGQKNGDPERAPQPVFANAPQQRISRRNLFGKAKTSFSFLPLCPRARGRGMEQVGWRFYLSGY